VQAGKVREIGCSNFSVEQLQEAEAAAAGKTGFSSVQNHYSLLHRDPEQGVLAECERQHLGFLPYFPLANGLLTGKYQKGQPPPPDTRLAAVDRFSGEPLSAQVTQMEALRAFVESRNHTLLELAFSWLLTRPVVASVIAGATKPEQIEANAAAVHWQLSPEDLAEIDRILG
ncbi:MAG: Oxidoreductase, partial [Chthonomonadales bacterium]|nr:Oxidoreductase [Chthonomonadales bacterium]